jgi:hypothetical protein
MVCSLKEASNIRAALSNFADQLIACNWQNLVVSFHFINLDTVSEQE